MKNKIILASNRLYLQEFQPSDAQNMYDLNFDYDVIKYTGDSAFKSVEDAAVFIQEYNHYQKYGFGRWSVFIKETHEYIGWCGLKQHDDGMVDIGFRYLKKYWNKGFATESAKACIDYGFQTLQMKEIVGRAAFDNKASIRVLEKLGMVFWKKDDCNGLEDAVYYRINISSYE